MTQTEVGKIKYIDIRAAVVFRYPNLSYHLGYLAYVHRIVVCGVGGY
jgi:hypothetical protein